MDFYMFIQKEAKLNGDQPFTPRRSRRKASESSVQSEQSAVVKDRKQSPAPSIGSIAEDQSEKQPNVEAETHSEIFQIVLFPQK